MVVQSDISAVTSQTLHSTIYIFVSKIDFMVLKFRSTDPGLTITSTYPVIMSKFDPPQRKIDLTSKKYNYGFVETCPNISIVQYKMST